MSLKKTTNYSEVAGNASDDDAEHNGLNGNETAKQRDDLLSDLSPLAIPEDVPPPDQRERKRSWKGSTNRYAVHLKDEWYIKYGGLRPPNSPQCVAIVYWAFMIYNVIFSFIHMFLVAGQGAECLMVEFLIEAFQVQSLVLYFIIYRLVDSDLLKTVGDSINTLEYRQKMRKKEILVFLLSRSDPKPIHLVHNQLIMTALIVAPSYLSGFSVFAVLIEHHWDGKEDHVFWYLGMASNVLDFIRYIPLIIHIAIVRSYFHIVQYHLADLCKEFDVAKDYEPGKPSHVEHREVIVKCEELLGPYRQFTGDLEIFIVVHFAFNVVALTLMIFVALQMFGDGHCAHAVNTTGNIANFIHYMIELVCFVALWMFVLMPIAKSHKTMNDKLVGRMLRKSHSDGTEKAAIDSYLRGLTNYSPFEVMGTPPTYGHIGNTMYAVAVAVASGVWAVFQDVHKDCDKEWAEVIDECGSEWGESNWFEEVCNLN